MARSRVVSINPRRRGGPLGRGSAPRGSRGGGAGRRIAIESPQVIARKIRSELDKVNGLIESISKSNIRYTVLTQTIKPVLEFLINPASHPEMREGRAQTIMQLTARVGKYAIIGGDVAGHTFILPAIRVLLKDGDPKVRQASAIALAVADETGAKERLVRMANNTRDGEFKKIANSILDGTFHRVEHMSDVFT